MKDIKLNACPFCGGEAWLYIDPHENSDTTNIHKIKCKDTFCCGAEMWDSLSAYSPDYEDEVKALAERWNKRAKPKEAADVEMLNDRTLWVNVPDGTVKQIVRVVVAERGGPWCLTLYVEGEK